MSCYVCGVPVYWNTRAEPNKYFAYFSILKFQPPRLTGLAVYREHPEVRGTLKYMYVLDGIFQNIIRFLGTLGYIEVCVNMLSLCERGPEKEEWAPASFPPFQS